MHIRKELTKYFRFLIFCLAFSAKHPLSKTYYVGNPSTVPVNALPWAVNILLLIIGVAVWCLSAHLGIVELAEPARLMVYGPTWTLLNFGTNYRSGKKILPPEV